jgi:PDZ domain-containing secreted protein
MRLQGNGRTQEKSHHGLNADRRCTDIRLKKGENQILSVGSMTDIPFEKNFDLIYEVKQKKAGDQSTLLVDRNGEKLEVEIIFKAPRNHSHPKGDDK